MDEWHAPSEAINEVWNALYDAVPARWHVGKPSFDPGRGAWSVTAWGPTPRRGKSQQSVSGTGDDEAAALRDLNDRLRGVPKPNGGRMDELRRRLRMAYMEGAEASSQENVGRGLTTEELGRVIER